LKLRNFKLRNSLGVSVFQVSTYRYFRYLRTGILDIYVPVFQVSTYRYFRYPHTGILGIYVPVFQVSAYRYLRYLRIGISGIYVSTFRVSTYWYFRYIRTGILGICVPVFQVYAYRYFRYPRTGILGIYVPVFQVSTYRYFARLMSVAMCHSKTFCLSQYSLRLLSNCWFRLVKAVGPSAVYEQSWTAHSSARAGWLTGLARGHSDRPFRRGNQSDLVLWAEYRLIVRCSVEWACSTDRDWVVVNRRSGAKRLVCLLCGASTRGAQETSDTWVKCRQKVWSCWSLFVTTCRWICIWLL
jgi:hypothetical protein